MARNIIAILVALLAAYIVWNVVEVVFSFALSTIWFLATLLPVLIVAVPIYLLVRRKLLR